MTSDNRMNHPNQQHEKTSDSSKEKSSGTSRGGESNFANDPERASEAGKKGGQRSHGSTERGSTERGSTERGGTERADNSHDSDRSQRTSEEHGKGSGRTQSGGHR
jgi:general stress protein YciG